MQRNKNIYPEWKRNPRWQCGRQAKTDENGTAYMIDAGNHDMLLGILS